MNLTSSTRRRGLAVRVRGFTLVELLVVIGIIALLISILLPSLNKARQSATKVKCMSNLRSLGQSISIYAASFKGQLPPGTRWQYDYNGYDWHSPSCTNWMLVMQGIFSKSAVSNYDDLFRNPASITNDARAYFLCPDAPRSSTANAGAYTNNVSYVFHPLYFGGSITGGAPDGGIIGGGYNAPLKPYNMANLRNSSETALLMDGTVIRDGDSVAQFYDNTGAFAVDGALMGKAGWTSKSPINLFSAGKLDANHPMDGSIDMTPSTIFKGTAADCNKDSDKNPWNVRFRHMSNTVANVLMADGHVDSFRFNPTKPMNDPNKTDLLRKYFYHR